MERFLTIKGGHMQDKVLAAILEEMKDKGVPKTFIALVEKMYDDQQELRRCIEGLMHGNDYQQKRVEKRLDALEEKIDAGASSKETWLVSPCVPEKAQKIKEECQPETGTRCNFPDTSVIGG